MSRQQQIKDKTQERGRLYEEAKRLLDAEDSRDDSGDLKTEIRAKADELFTKMDTLRDEIAELERDERFDQRLAEERDWHARRASRRREPRIDPQRRARMGSQGLPVHPGIQLRGSDDYEEAFWAALRMGILKVQEDHRARLTSAEIRALQVGTDSEGGYLVPTEFERMLVEILEELNIMRTVATTITTGASREIPIEAGHGTASWIAEEGAYGESDESFAQKVMDAWKVGRLIKISEELLMDSAFPMAPYLARRLAESIAIAEEAAFVAGDGTAKPEGVVPNATVGVTAASATAVAADEIINMYHEPKRRYRARSSWLMADSTALAIRKLKDGDNQYLWQPGLQAGQPDRLLGRPVVISDNVPAIATGNRSIAFGDMSYYWIGDREQTVIRRLDELYAANGQVGFRGHRRVDGLLTLAEAVQVLVHP